MCVLSVSLIGFEGWIITNGYRQIPERADNSSDTIQMDLQFLLPQTSTPTDLGVFVTNLPMFKQVLGNLSQIFFGHFQIVDPGSSITAGVRRPISLYVQRCIDLCL